MALQAKKKLPSCRLSMSSRTNLDDAAFKQLFRDAHTRCFGYELSAPLSETESKTFCTRVLDQTGLVIGWKSVKNYSAYARPEPSQGGKRENPSLANRETLARYVFDTADSDLQDAPYVNWLRYRESYYRQLPTKAPPSGMRSQRIPDNADDPELPTQTSRRVGRPYNWKRWKPLYTTGWGRLLISESIRHSWLAWCALGLALGLIGVWIVREHNALSAKRPFSDRFTSISEPVLSAQGWTLQYRDSFWWNRREENPGQLTMFTLEGDNWSNARDTPWVGNLLVRPIPTECFTTEVRFSHFLPRQDWQQAGLLLMEDSTLSSRCIRLSIAYNDFLGGIGQPREIIIQGITTGGTGSGQPEEILHKPIFQWLTDNDSLVAANMSVSALRIQKQGHLYRFMYACGPTDNVAFKVGGALELNIEPRYIGLFALKGYKASTEEIPVGIQYFNLTPEPCDP
jgi:hypothetical protein